MLPDDPVGSESTVDRRPVAGPGDAPISRRRVLRAATVAGGLALATGGASARQDMDPYVFGIDEADLQGDGTIRVAGPCDVPNPSEEVALNVRVRGAQGARAVGRATVTCGGTDTFAVFAGVRGTGEFATGETVTVCATARVNPDDEPAGVVRWCADVEVS